MYNRRPEERKGDFKAGVVRKMYLCYILTMSGDNDNESKNVSPIGIYGHLAAFIVLGAAVFVVYSNTYNSPFLFDDMSHILKNYRIDDLSQFWPPSGMRYLGRLSFALTYRFSGTEVFGYHVVNNSIHFAGSFLVYLLAYLTFKTPLVRSAAGVGDYAPFCASVAAALIFAVHPIQTSAVTYIVQRLASMAALFYLLSLVLFVSWRLGRLGSPARAILLVLSLVTALMAQMTKENAITLPVVIVLYDLVFFNDVKGAVKRLIYLSPYIAVFAIVPLTIIAIKSKFGLEGLLESARTVSDLVAAVMTPYEYLINQFSVMATYIRLIFLPIGQNLDYDYPLSPTIFNARIILSLLFLILVLGASLYVFVRSRRAGKGLPALAVCGVFWFFITLSVESSIIPINDVIYEHRLYLPLAGVSIGFSSAALLLYSFLKERFGISIPLYAAAAVFILITALPLGVAAYARNGVWRDSISLWSDVVSKTPNKSRVHNNLANAYREFDRVPEAIEEYKAAIRLAPENPEAHSNLGDAYLASSRIDEAIEEFKLAVKYLPEYSGAHNNLGNAYHVKGMPEEAVKALTEALRHNPRNVIAYYNLGIVYEDTGRYSLAVENYRKFVEYAPDQFAVQRAIVRGVIEDLSAKKDDDKLRRGRRPPARVKRGGARRPV